MLLNTLSFNFKVQKQLFMKIKRAIGVRGPKKGLKSLVCKLNDLLGCFQAKGNLFTKLVFTFDLKSGSTCSDSGTFVSNDPDVLRDDLVGRHAPVVLARTVQLVQFLERENFQSFF